MIDRDGKHFSTVLNYLRDGSVPLPESHMECEELLVEARWGGVGMRGREGWAGVKGRGGEKRENEKAGVK